MERVQRKSGSSKRYEKTEKKPPLPNVRSKSGSQSKTKADKPEEKKKKNTFLGKITRKMARSNSLSEPRSKDAKKNSNGSDSESKGARDRKIVEISKQRGVGRGEPARDVFRHDHGEAPSLSHSVGLPRKGKERAERQVGGREVRFARPSRAPLQEKPSDQGVWRGEAPLNDDLTGPLNSEPNVGENSLSFNGEESEQAWNAMMAARFAAENEERAAKKLTADQPKSSPGGPTNINFFDDYQPTPVVNYTDEASSSDQDNLFAILDLDRPAKSSSKERHKDPRIVAAGTLVGQTNGWNTPPFAELLEAVDLLERELGHSTPDAGSADFHDFWSAFRTKRHFEARLSKIAKPEEFFKAQLKHSIDHIDKAYNRLITTINTLPVGKDRTTNYNSTHIAIQTAATIFHEVYNEELKMLYDIGGGMDTLAKTAQHARLKRFASTYKTIVNALGDEGGPWRAAEALAGCLLEDADKVPKRIKQIRDCRSNL